MRTFICAAFIGLSLAFTTPASAQLHIGLGIRIGPPPPPREEVVVVRPPHRGWVWIPGNYQWKPRRQQYVWVRGHWIKPPHAHVVWTPGRWEMRNNEWVFFEGRWDKEHREDRDRR